MISLARKGGPEIIAEHEKSDMTETSSQPVPQKTKPSLFRQLELDMRYPQFTQHLLEIVYPHYLAPVPAMFVAQFVPEQGLDKKFTLKRGTKMRSPLREGDQTACEFRTAHEVDLWPVKITEVQYFAGRGEVVAAGFGDGNAARAAVRLRLRAPAGKKLSELSRNCQIIVVTHQPQVAAYAKSHMLIAKTNAQESTTVAVSALSQEQQNEEIARMLSGEGITKESLAAAQSLINRAVA